MTEIATGSPSGNQMPKHKTPSGSSPGCLGSPVNTTHDMTAEQGSAEESSAPAKHRKPRGGITNLRPAWQPGQSGNPNGRPKKVQQVVDKAQANADKALTKLVKLIDSDDDRVALQAAQAVLDRAVGKPKQTIEDGRKSGASDYTVDELRAIARMGSTGTAQTQTGATEPDQLQPLHASLVHAGSSSRDDRGEAGSGFARRN